jgi:hypothetical protein
MKYRIESGIPIPPRKGRGTDPNSFAGILRSLKKGQSIFRKGDKTAIATAAFNALGKGCSAVRKVDGGYRIWRIK